MKCRTQINKEVVLIQKMVVLMFHKIQMVLQDIHQLMVTPIPADDLSKYQGVEPPEKGEQIMSSEDFVNALEKGDNLGAEDGFFF